MIEFTPVKPMGLKLSSEIPSAGYLFQVKWDGVRIMALFSRGEVVLYNRHLRLRTRQYPELQRLRELLKGPDVLLDGEMISPRIDGGTTSFSALLKRDFSARYENVRTIPVHYVAFDIVQFDGNSICHWPLEDRLGKLREVVTEQGSEISVIEDFTQGESIFKATAERDMEGIVAKRRGSPYLPGHKTDMWLKIKHRKKGKFLIAGYTLRSGRVNSLVMGEQNDSGELRMVGKTASGLTQQQIDLLTRELPRLVALKRPTGFPRNAIPVYPFLTAEVEFMEWTDELLLRSPVLKSISFGGDSHQSF